MTHATPPRPERITMPTDQTPEPVCKFDEGCHRVVPCKPGCGAPAAVPVPPPADQTATGSGRAAEAELYVLLRKAGEPRHEAQALIDRHRAEVLRRVAAEEQPAETQDCRALMRAHAALAEQAGRDQRALARIRQMADAWEQRLPQVIRTPAVVSAIRSALPDETDRPKRTPMDPVHILGIDAAPERPAVGEQPETQEAPRPRTVCVCGHTRGEHVTVSGRLLCDECDPDSTNNLVCRGFDAL